MKPLMLIPPAQVEALYDAPEDAPMEGRFAPLPWLDDDLSEEEPRAKPSSAEADAQSRSWKVQRRAA